MDITEASLREGIFISLVFAPRLAPPAGLTPVAPRLRTPVDDIFNPQPLISKEAIDSAIMDFFSDAQRFLFNTGAQVGSTAAKVTSIATPSKTHLDIKDVENKGVKPQGEKTGAPSGNPPKSPFIGSFGGDGKAKKNDTSGVKTGDFKRPLQAAAIGGGAVAAGVGLSQGAQQASDGISKAVEKVGDSIGEALLPITDPLGLSEDTDGDGKPDNKNLGKLVAYGFIALLVIGGVLFVVSRAK